LIPLVLSTSAALFEAIFVPVSQDQGNVSQKQDGMPSSLVVGDRRENNVSPFFT
jgi:hypothetical protein